MALTLASTFFSMINTAIADTWYSPPGLSAADDYSQNPVWLVGSTQQIVFQTDLDSWGLTMESPLQEGLQFISGNQRNSAKNQNITINWTVQTYNFSTDVPQVYKFFVANGTAGSDVDSRPFNITHDAAVAASASASLASLTATSLATAAPTGSDRAAAAPPATASGASSSGSDHSTAVGLGVGLGVGIPIVILLAALLYLVLKGQRRVSRTGSFGPGENPPVYSDAKYAHNSDPTGGQPQEPQGNFSPVEAPAEAAKLPR